MTELRSTIILQETKIQGLLYDIYKASYFTSKGKNLETSMINRLRKKQTGRNEAESAEQGKGKVTQLQQCFGLPGGVLWLEVFVGFQFHVLWTATGPVVCFWKLGRVSSNVVGKLLNKTKQIHAHI